MAFTNSTDNYHLPQYINTDIPSYLVDQNDAWETIDTNLKSVSDVSNTASETATSASSAAETAQTTATEGLTKANHALSNEADTFSESKTYDVGEYVIYGNVLYICTNAVTVAGPFSGADWDAITITDKLVSQSEAISAIKYTDFKVFTYTYDAISGIEATNSVVATPTNSLPSGYTVLSLIECYTSTNASYFAFQGIHSDGTARFRNVTSSATATLTLNVKVLIAKVM